MKGLYDFSLCVTFARQGGVKQQTGLGTGLASPGCASRVVTGVETGIAVILHKENADRRHSTSLTLEKRLLEHNLNLESFWFR